MKLHAMLRALSLSVYTTISKIRTTELLVTTTGIEATEHLRISGWVEASNQS